MLITFINKTAVLSNLFGDFLKGILTLIIDGRFHHNKDMYTILISYDYDYLRYPNVDLQDLTNW